MNQQNHMQGDEIHIGFGIHDKTGTYCSWLGAAIQSIVEHSDANMCFHVLHDESLTDDNIEKLHYVVGKHRICFHLLDASVFTSLEEQLKGYTIGAMFRVKLPEVLSDLERVIYLDADLFVNRDIEELWNTDIDDYYMAAVPDIDVYHGIIKPNPVRDGEVEAKQYFNSGVLYMNLALIREKGDMGQEILQYLAEHKDSDLPDQDALNVIYRDKIRYLDFSWNCFVKRERRLGQKGISEQIYHYVGTRCLLYYLSEYDFAYFETMNRTPWGQVECDKILKHSMERVLDINYKQEMLLRQVSRADKKFIFYGEETGAMRNVYDIVTIREGDYRVLDNPIEDPYARLSCRPLSAIMEEKEAFAVFVLPQADGGSAIRNLEKMGLKLDEDFFTIPRMLMPHKGGYV